jgi:chromate reductase
MPDMNPPRILVFAGSARAGSLNKKLARAAAQAIGEAGGRATFLDLAEHRLPLYDGDLEGRDGVPQTARALRELFAAHQGFVLSSPENNGSVSALLKNTLDWLSRPDGQVDKRAAFRGKPVALLSASPGQFGGLRHLVHLGVILSNLEMLVLPEPFGLARADKAFDADGALIDQRARDEVQATARRIVDITVRLSA